MTRFPLLALPLSLAVLLGACDPDEAPDPDAAAADPQEAFWENLQGLCETAYEGELLRAPEGDDQVDPEARLVVHFWECGDDELRFPFHVGEDRSRTWVLLRHEDHIELRHDHRYEDGSEEENTWYGDTTMDEGTPYLQEFVSEVEGVRRGWRIEIDPGQHYTYGTIRDGDWRHHLEFDLTQEVELPPLPWGHEERPSALR